MYDKAPMDVADDVQECRAPLPVLFSYIVRTVNMMREHSEIYNLKRTFYHD